MIDILLPLAQKVSANTKKFYLAGGTAIMLKYDHRVSYDLDFFHGKAFSFKAMENKMKSSLSNVTQVIYGEDNLDVFKDENKVSFVFFPFRNVIPIENFKAIRIASDLDLLLNKLYVGSRRIDAKDPFDAAWLWQKFEWDALKVKELFEQKFKGHSFEIALGALCSFEDYPELDGWVKGVLKEKVNSLK